MKFPSKITWMAATLFLLAGGTVAYAFWAPHVAPALSPAAGIKVVPSLNATTIAPTRIEVTREAASVMSKIDRDAAAERLLGLSA